MIHPLSRRAWLDSVSRASTPTQQTRNIFNFFRNRKVKSEQNTATSNPVLDEFLKNKAKKPARASGPEGVVYGDLAPTSIFSEAVESQPSETRPVEAEVKRNAASMAVVLDPRPRARERWQRKMVIRQVTRAGRLNREQFIKRTERESHSRSPNFKTSVKKLGPLVRQIAGKKVDDAITQMRFSPKKAAKDVLRHLEYARDEAVVARGMGMGMGMGRDGTPEDIRLKNGKRHTVSHRTDMYISQAWVGRGPFGQLPDFRARGQVNKLRPPWTHLSVQLKEEATRVREHEEREAKRRQRRANKVWVPLPDRPLIGQRPWYSW